MYFLTMQIINWIDIFTRRIYRDIIIDSFKYSIENKGFDVFAYVIMSNQRSIEKYCCILISRAYFLILRSLEATKN